MSTDCLNSIDCISVAHVQIIDIPAPAAFVRDLVACLGKLLLAQEVASGVWSSPNTLKTFYGLLSFFREKCVDWFVDPVQGVD